MRNGLGDKVAKRFPFHLAIIIAITLAMFFTWDLSQRVLSGAHLNEIWRQSEQQLAQAQATRAALLAQKTRIASQAYVEEIARGKLGWSREGETVVQVIVTPAPTSTPTPAPRPTATPEPTIWEWLWRLVIP